MSKKCAKCEKPVYPAEELKCLDKVWHKPCFRCWECNMALTINNHKGFNKLPYCKAHYPQISATSVADTPAMRLSMQNTKFNSEVEKQKNFLQSMGSRGGRPSQGGAEDYDHDNSGSSYQAHSDAHVGGGGGRAPPAAASSQGLVYTALYDYEAQDDDEVGFQENDRIVECEVIDEGWVKGTVERTGDRGMIPANYIEQA